MTACAKGCGRTAVRRGMCHNHYEQVRTRRHGYGTWESEFVDAAPTRAHVSQLQAAGLGLRRISDLAGLNRKTVQYLMTGRPERGTGPSSTISRRNAQRLLNVSIPNGPQHVHLADRQLVDAIGTVRRLQALVAIGYPRDYLARRVGIHKGNATRLFRLESTHVLAETARTVDALFRELQLTPGHSVRARNEGQRRGWPPPLAWDEDTIDDPAAQPQLGEQSKASFEEQYQELVDCGYADWQIAKQLGIDLNSLLRRLQRYQIPLRPELVEMAGDERNSRRRAKAS